MTKKGKLGANTYWQQPIFKEMREANYKMNWLKKLRNKSKYEPHQGAQEMARRKSRWQKTTASPV